MTITITFENGSTITVATTASSYAADIQAWEANQNVVDVR